MGLIGRVLISFLLVIAMLLTFASIYAEWLFEQCTITDQLGNRVSLIDLQRQGEQLAQESDTIIERLRSKDIVAESLCQDKITLVEAAAFFRSLYDHPKLWRHPHRPRPDHNDGETWCREVIEWTVTKVRLEQSSSQADAIRQRLERELQKHLVDFGTVILPD